MFTYNYIALFNRCMASCVAVTTAISLMMQQKHLKKNGQIDVDEIIAESYRYATQCLLDRPIEEVCVFHGLNEQNILYHVLFIA